jgi:hypothetical protein
VGEVGERSPAPRRVQELHDVERFIRRYQPERVTFRVESSLRWEHVRDVAVTAQHAFISGGSKSPTSIVVPKRAFAEEQGFLEFIETINNFRQAARQVAQGTSSPNA